MDDRVRLLAKGTLIGLGDSGEARAGLVGCRTVGDDRHEGEIELRENAAYFVVATASDRDDVRLVEVTAPAGAPARLVLEHYFPGKGCAVTDDYKGALVLLLEGPVGARPPKVEIRDVPEPC